MIEERIDRNVFEVINLHEAVVERYDRYEWFGWEKPYRKNSLLEAEIKADREAIEEGRIPNTEYRREKLKEQEVREKAMRKRKRLAGQKMMQSMKRRRQA